MRPLLGRKICAAHEVFDAICCFGHKRHPACPSVKWHARYLAAKARNQAARRANQRLRAVQRADVSPQVRANEMPREKGPWTNICRGARIAEAARAKRSSERPLKAAFRSHARILQKHARADSSRASESFACLRRAFSTRKRVGRLKLRPSRSWRGCATPPPR
jgi:hypothetical protein